jgi:hypothetical protein
MLRLTTDQIDVLIDREGLRLDYSDIDRGRRPYRVVDGNGRFSSPTLTALMTNDALWHAIYVRLRERSARELVESQGLTLLMLDGEVKIVHIEDLPAIRARQLPVREPYYAPALLAELCRQYLKGEA